MSAGASGEAMELLSCLPHRRLHGYKCRFANLIGDEESAVSEAADCTCGAVKPMLDFARKIDALVARKVEEERAATIEFLRAEANTLVPYIAKARERGEDIEDDDDHGGKMFQAQATNLLALCWKLSQKAHLIAAALRTPPPATRG